MISSDHAFRSAALGNDEPRRVFERCGGMGRHARRGWLPLRTQGIVADQGVMMSSPGARNVCQLSPARRSENVAAGPATLTPHILANAPEDEILERGSGGKRFQRGVSPSAAGSLMRSRRRGCITAETPKAYLAGDRRRPSASSGGPVGLNNNCRRNKGRRRPTAHTRTAPCGPLKSLLN